MDIHQVAKDHGLTAGEVRARWLTLRVAMWKADFRRFAQEVVRIRTKKGELAPLVLNEAQLALHKAGEQMLRREKWIRLIAVKGRRQGFSTYVEARGYWRATLWDRQKIYILSHEMKSADALFDMVALMQEKNDFPPEVGVDNAKELEFKQRGSSYTVATAGQKAGGRGAGVSFFHGCLSPDSWIIEPHGNAKRMGDFKVGDYVCTHTGRVAPISFISRQSKPALSVKMMGASEPLVATPEHKVWTKDGMKPLGNLMPGDAIGYPVTELGDQTLEWVFRRDYPRAAGGGSPAVGPDTVQSSYELGRILGLYLAEGTIIRRHGSKDCGAVSFAIHERETVRTLEWLKPLQGLFRNAPRVAARKNSKTVTVTVGSRSFGELVEELCGSKDSKRMPLHWALHRDFAHGLVVGYFAGDGGGEISMKTRRIQAPSIRSAITFGMRDALAALGYGWTTVTRREGAVRHGRNEQTQWTIRLSGVGVDKLWVEMGRNPVERRKSLREANFSLSDGYAWLPIVSIDHVGHTEVMDFEVDHPDHSYCTWQGAVSNSEAAWWTNAKDHFAASVQSVDEVKGQWGVLWRRPAEPLPFEKPEFVEGWIQAPSEIWLETTSAGPTGEYYRRYIDAMKGIGRYKHVFVPWTLTPEYTEEGDFEPFAEPEEEGAPSEIEYQGLYGLSDEQMLWRRGKIQELGSVGRFRQEYPTTIDEAFSDADTEAAFIKGIHILRARKRKMEAPDAPLIVGIDPAGAGGDRFAIAWRRGDRCMKIEHRNRLEHDEAVAWICRVIDEDTPSKVCIDRGSMGGNILSSIRAMGPKYATVMKGVDFGGKSQAKMANPGRSGPFNRRAEIYGRLRDWLPEAAIPDDDDLASDLAGPRTKYRANNDWMLESKTDMKARGVRSPDLADALALTFATQEFFESWSKPDRTKGFAAGTDEVIYIDKREPQAFYGTHGWMG